jgi:hypothetical protein
MATPTVVADGVSTNLYTTNEKPIDMFTNMFKNYPGLTPLTSILTKIASDATSQSTVYWTEQEEIPNTMVMTAAATSSGDLTSTQYTHARKNDIWYYPATGERLRFKATPTSGAITTATYVTRAWGASTGYAIPAGAVLVKLSPAYEENTSDVNPRHVVNSEVFNYTQELDKHTRHSRRTMNEATHFGGKGTKRTEDNQKMWRDFRKELEMNLWFQTLGNTTGTTYYIKTMRGIEERLRSGTNYYQCNGILTESKLDGWLTDIWSQFPDTASLAAFPAPKVYSTINQMCKPLIRLSPNSKRYGMKLNQYTGALNLDLIPHPLFAQPGLEEWMFVLDMGQLSLVYQDRPTMELNISSGEGRYTTDRIYTLLTMRLANEARHGMMVGIKG